VPELSLLDVLIGRPRVEDRQFAVGITEGARYSDREAALEVIADHDPDYNKQQDALTSAFYASPPFAVPLESPAVPRTASIASRVRWSLSGHKWE
jgi:hypothetical protein